MATVKLIEIAHGRSGDKGDGSNVGVIARHPDVYPFLKENLTADVVKEHMKHICKGEVERYELPNIGALNFVLHESLGGGGTVSLKLDAQGKTHASMLLRMELDVPEELLEKVKEKYPDIEVSMISAYGNSDYLEKALASGAKEFFTKPIDFKSLKDEISKIPGN